MLDDGVRCAGEAGKEDSQRPRSWKGIGGGVVERQPTRPDRPAREQRGGHELHRGERHAQRGAGKDACSAREGAGDDQRVDEGDRDREMQVLGVAGEAAQRERGRERRHRPGRTPQVWGRDESVCREQRPG